MSKSSKSEMTNKESEYMDDEDEEVGKVNDESSRIREISDKKLESSSDKIALRNLIKFLNVYIKDTDNLYRIAESIADKVYNKFFTGFSTMNMELLAATIYWVKDELNGKINPLGWKSKDLDVLISQLSKHKNRPVELRLKRDMLRYTRKLFLAGFITERDKKRYNQITDPKKPGFKIESI